MRFTRRDLTPVLSWLGLAVVVFVLPSFLSSFRAQELAYVAIYLIALVGLEILTGYTGQISLGHGAFMAIGGYTSAILMVDHGVKDLYTLPISVAVCFVAGLLVGLPALRLSGLYLALATFAVAVSLPAVIKKFEGFTGGGPGLNLFGIPQLTGGIAGVHVFGHTLVFNDWLYYLSWTLALVSLAVAWLLLRGRLGRAFRAIRDSETAAASFGVNLALYKTLSFGISAAFAGLAGSLFAIANAYVNPDTFPITLSIFLLVGVVVGGLGSLYGLIAGAVLLQYIDDVAQSVSKSPGAPSVIFGVVLIVIMVLIPTGASGLLRRIGSLAGGVGRSR